MTSKEYLADIRFFVLSKKFIVCVLAVSILSYGFAATNVSVGIDDLEVERYIGDGMELLASGRFSTYLWSVLFGYNTNLPQNSFVIDVLSIVMFILATINYCILFRRIAGTGVSILCYTIFSCVLISYPLMLEIWEYTGANLNVCIGYLFVSYSLLLMQDQIRNSSWKRPWRVIVSVLLMTLVCGGYESLAVVYVFFVFAILGMQIIFENGKGKSAKNIFRQGIIYAMILVCGVILRVIVHQIILRTMNLTPVINGKTEILWGQKSKWTIAKELLCDGILSYVLKGLVYLPITELLIAVVVFLFIGVFLCKKYGWILLISGGGMLFSLILLSVLQGTLSPYRTCQVFAVFVAFTAMMLYYFISSRIKNGHINVRRILVIGFGALCLHQAVYMSYFFSLNHMRSEEEIYTVHDIGTELLASNDEEKPVIFVGKYVLSESIQEMASVNEDSLQWAIYSQLYEACCEKFDLDDRLVDLNRKIPQTNISSVIDWGITAFDQEGLQHLFAYFGYDFSIANYGLLYADAEEYAKRNMPCYPQDGFIEDVGEYVIVNLEQCQ